MTIWVPALDQFTGPRYRALADAIESAIHRGELAPGSRLPTHRALADRLGVTVGTVTRGYAEAERRDLVSARVGSGTYVREHPEGGDFSLPDENGADRIDLSLSISVPGQRERLLAETLRQLQQQPEQLASLLTYPPEAGYRSHRQAGADWLVRHGLRVDADRVLVCSGGQHALSLCLQALTRPGDTLLSEGLCFPGLIGAARQQRLRHVGLPLDDAGILPDQLDAYCLQHHPRVLYCTPNLHNPTTAHTPEARRRQLVAVCRRHDLQIIEDDVQVYDARGVPSLAELAPERTYHLSSVSKALSGGLRVGFLAVPPGRIEALTRAMRNSCLTSPPLMAEIVARWLADGRADSLIRWQQQEVAARAELALTLFRGRALRYQPGGFYFWLHLPETWRAAAFVDQCERRGVLIKGAETFAVGRYPAPQAVRVSISPTNTRERLRRGLLEIATLLDQEPSLDTDPI